MGGACTWPNSTESVDGRGRAAEVWPAAQLDVANRKARDEERCSFAAIIARVTAMPARRGPEPSHTVNPEFTIYLSLIPTGIEVRPI